MAIAGLRFKDYLLITLNIAGFATLRADFELSAWANTFHLLALTSLNALVITIWPWLPHASTRSRVSSPPGSRLRRLAELCFGEKTLSAVFEPCLSDLQLEYFAALAAGDRWKARFVLVRGHWAFWTAFLARVPLLRVLASLLKVVR